MKRLAPFAFLLTALLWGSYFAITKTMVAHVDAWAFAFADVAATAPICFGLLWWFRRHLSADVWRGGLLLGALLALNLAPVTLALTLTTATNAAFFPSINGIAAALGMAALGCRVARKSWGAGILAALGAGMLILEGAGNGRLWGDVLALAAALGYVVYLFQADRVSRRLAHAHPHAMWPLLAIEMLALALVLGLLALPLADWHTIYRLTPKAAGVTAFVGVGTTLIPAGIALAFQRHLAPVSVALIYVLEPVFGAIIAALFLGERLSAQGYFGAGLILAGAVWNAWPAKSPGRP